MIKTDSVKPDKKVIRLTTSPVIKTVFIIASDFFIPKWIIVDECPSFLSFEISNQEKINRLDSTNKKT